MGIRYKFSLAQEWTPLRRWRRRWKYLGCEKAPTYPPDVCPYVEVPVRWGQNRFLFLATMMNQQALNVNATGKESDLHQSSGVHQKV